MARSRNIKPGFFVNDELAECPPLARLMFIGLWTLADATGRLKDKPRQIKAQTLPYDDCDPDSLLNNLDLSGFIQRYSVQGQPTIQVVNFVEHQNPHINERKKGSAFGSYDDRDNESDIIQEHRELSSLIETNLDKSDTNHEDSLLPHTDSLEKHIVEKGGETMEQKEAMRSIIEYLNEKAGKKFRGTDSNIKFIRARLGQGYTIDDMRAVVDRKVAEWLGTKMAEYLRPSTLFNDEKFNQYFGELDSPMPEKELILPDWAKMPKIDDQLPGWARRNSWPDAQGNESYPMYRQRLQRLIDERLKRE